LASLPWLRRPKKNQWLRRRLRRPKKEPVIKEEAPPVQKEAEQSEVEKPETNKPPRKAEEKPKVVKEAVSSPSFAYQLAIVLAAIAALSVGYFFYSQLKGVDLSNLI